MASARRHAAATPSMRRRKVTRPRRRSVTNAGRRDGPLLHGLRALDLSRPDGGGPYPSYLMARRVRRQAATVSCERPPTTPSTNYRASPKPHPPRRKRRDSPACAASTRPKGPSARRTRCRSKGVPRARRRTDVKHRSLLGRRIDVGWRTRTKRRCDRRRSAFCALVEPEDVNRPAPSNVTPRGRGFTAKASTRRRRGLPGHLPGP